MLHLTLGLLLLALSLLAVVHPPHSVLWMLSIPVREWGWVFALLCLPLLWPGWIASVPAAAGVALALTALVLFLVPLGQAAAAARRLPQVGAALPGGRPAPFVWKDLFFGVRAPRVPLQTVTYAVHDGVELKMDLTRPAATPAPAVLVIHGGAWRSGDRKQLPALNRYLTARGFVTAYYGPFALEWGYDQVCRVLDVKTVLGDVLGGSPAEAPPVLLIQGADDTMVAPAHCHHLIEHLEAAGRPYEFVLVPRATHASDLAFSGAFGQISTWATERFVWKVTQ